MTTLADLEPALSAGDLVRCTDRSAELGDFVEGATYKIRKHPTGKLIVADAQGVDRSVSLINRTEFEKMYPSIHANASKEPDKRAMEFHPRPSFLKPYDPVNSPKHYTNHPSGIECIEITRHMGFNLGNAVKYIWRCGLKGDEIEDLKKAVFYLNDEIKRREEEANV